MEFEGNDPTVFMKSVLETGQSFIEFGFTGGDKEILMPADMSLNYSLTYNKSW